MLSGMLLLLPIPLIAAVISVLLVWSAATALLLCVNTIRQPSLVPWRSFSNALQLRFYFTLITPIKRAPAEADANASTREPIHWNIESYMCLPVVSANFPLLIELNFSSGNLFWSCRRRAMIIACYFFFGFRLRFPNGLIAKLWVISIIQFLLKIILIRHLESYINISMGEGLRKANKYGLGP